MERGWASRWCDRSRGCTVVMLLWLRATMAPAASESRYRGFSPEGGQNTNLEHRALRWDARRRWRSPKALLLPVADAIGDLVCEKDFTLVRKCEGPGCTLWFLDVSKGHARRWCSMGVCGNRVKAAAHRARARRGP